MADSSRKGYPLATTIGTRDGALVASGTVQSLSGKDAFVFNGVIDGARIKMRPGIGPVQTAGSGTTGGIAASLAISGSRLAVYRQVLPGVTVETYSVTGVSVQSYPYSASAAQIFPFEYNGYAAFLANYSDNTVWVTFMNSAGAWTHANITSQLTIGGNTFKPQGVAVLDQYLFIVANASVGANGASIGYILNSAVGDPSTGYSTNFLQSDLPLFGCFVHSGFFVACTSGGMRVYYDAANATGSVLGAYAQANNSRVVTGSGSPGFWGFPVLVGAEGTYFIASANNGGFSVFYMATGGLSFEPISNDAVNRVLSYQYNNIGAAIFGATIASFPLYGKTCISFAIGQTNNNAVPDISLVYVPGNGWCAYGSPYSQSQSSSTVFAGCVGNSNYFFVPGVQSQPYHHIMLATSPSQAVFTDDGVNYPLIVQTGSETDDKNYRKFVYRLTPIGSRPSTSAPVTVDYTDNDYQSFQATPRQVDMSLAKPTLCQLGSYYERGWRLTFGGGQYLELEELQPMGGQGTS